MLTMSTQMRKATLRQFQRNLSKEVKDLPVLVTKDGSPSFVVIPYRQLIEILQQASTDSSEVHIQSEISSGDNEGLFSLLFSYIKSLKNR